MKFVHFILTKQRKGHPSHKATEAKGGAKMLYKNIVRPILFRLTREDPEIAHEWAIKWLQILGSNKLTSEAVKKLCAVTSDRLGQKIFGLQFPNPVGLAAGFDKNGEAIAGLSSLGFGFITAGTVTPLGQKGNDRPRIFRLPENRALINRMGFNNSGATALALRLSIDENRNIPVGASIGKMKNTTIENAIEDYLSCLRSLYNFADYFEINVSSPNTAGLRALQRKNYLEKLLMALNREMAQLAKRCKSRFKPIIPKIAPDLNRVELDDILEVCVRQRMMGIAVANTTINRDGLKSKIEEIGGLSGEPLRERTLEMVRYISKSTDGALPIIGVGGIFNAEDAYEMFKAGASLIQVFTGMIYEGPFIARNINRGLVKIFERERVKHISEIRGGKRNEKIGKCFIARRPGCQPHY
ncbi:MAG TPA: quinone-dependent dihydroorotate dehydrogenase [Patescibacteria group bacterium]|nr:quinone-dependent dihydroorotate dehydrogenase [Patescibacteria group bacterium]